MTPVQIAYFKHFMFDCSVQKHYIGTYRTRRQKENPESLEEFLQEASLAKAIMGAFYFKPGSEYGFDYWSEIKDKWLKYWELHADNPKNSSYMFLKGGFSILRQNWDKPMYFEKESIEDTYKRMHIEKPDIDDALFEDKSKKVFVPKFKVGDTVRGTISGDICKITSVIPDHACYLTDDDGAIDFEREEYWELVPEAAQEVEEKTSDEEPMELIDFSDVPEYEEKQEEEKPKLKGFLDGFSLEEFSNDIGSKKMGKNKVSVNLRSGSYRINFPITESTKIRKHSCKYCSLLSNRNDRVIALTFNNSRGCKTSGTRTSGEKYNIGVNSKEMVLFVKKFFDIKEDYFLLDVVSTTVENDKTTYILTYKE